MAMPGRGEKDGRKRVEAGEVPEIIIVSVAVEGTFLDLDGESRREQVEAKLSRREREAPSEEGEEIESPKRKVIRVESEETQDYVREAKSTEHKEEEERTFVPSAVSVPPKPLFRRDNQCSEKTLNYWQLASVVVNDGDEAYMTNLCQKCFYKHLQPKGEKTAVKCAVETGGGKEGVSRKDVENDGERNIFAWDVGILSPRKKKHIKEVSRAG